MLFFSSVAYLLTYCHKLTMLEQKENLLFIQLFDVYIYMFVCVHDFVVYLLRIVDSPIFDAIFGHGNHFSKIRDGESETHIM